MTKLDWTKADVHNPDPGAVVEVHDNGGIWCGNDARPFVPRSRLLRMATQKAKKRRASRRKNEVAGVLRRSPLRVPLGKARLIASVMRDLGRPIPDRIKSVNKAVERLIHEGVILPNGDFNLRHPLMQRWLARFDRHETET